MRNPHEREEKAIRSPNPYSDFELIPAIYDGSRYEYATTPAWTVATSSSTNADVYTGHLLREDNGLADTNSVIQFKIFGAEGKPEAISQGEKLLVFAISPDQLTQPDWIPEIGTTYQTITGPRYFALPIPASKSANQLAVITVVHGSSLPFVYSANLASLNTNNGITQNTNAAINANLRSIKEVSGSGYPGAGKIPVGCPVIVWQDSGSWWCDEMGWRGTYS